MKILPASRVNDLLMTQRKQWHLLSVCREKDLPMTIFAKSHCHLNCDDVRESDLPNLALEQRNTGVLRIPPNHGHIETALRYAREVGMEQLILHCQAGMSRSPAVAWCILLDHFNDTRRASEELFRIRPEAEPSRTIIRLGLELLRIPGTSPEGVLAEFERLTAARIKSAAR